ncbi:MAG TPA: DeoR/GlpR family DNA-binding transcription regulator [Aliidongia sp.]|uniref:DeoR/GlpR family DNA-binding transcription regulator n=1 Tax=Aliidongia sp. TaxID=1914230 RepID=UPI002DDDB86A|nr:DeoR/GlpR family DNA-binding transcription regulator [Aliidongia sp.]HEV2677510.1 DeoR/GlpR family DNA-binding transcription regulator [Aliidongia sp.]
MDNASTRIGSRRQSEIVGLLRETGRVTVEDLAARFAVTPQTIRRDLNEMSEARLVTRIHGGAMIASGVANLGYEARKQVAGPHKRLIGEAAARLIPDDSSLFINIGTTTEEVAHALMGHAGLLVITNNLNVAAELHRNGAINLVIAGGSVRTSDGGIVGASTVDLIRQFRVDTAVIGTSAIDGDGTLLDFDIREVTVSRAIIESARRIILVADSSKFARSAPVRIATLAEIDVLVTDRLPAGPIAELCRAHQVTVIETGGPVEPGPTAE